VGWGEIKEGGMWGEWRVRRKGCGVVGELGGRDVGWVESKEGGMWGEWRVWREGCGVGGE